MSLSSEPVERFIQRGNQFFEKPDVMTALEFDDAVVVFKRYALDQLKSTDIAYMLADFAGLIRALDSASLRPKFDRVLEKLAQRGMPTTR